MRGHKLENGHSNVSNVEIEKSRVTGIANGKENTSSNIGAFDANEEVGKHNKPDAKKTSWFSSMFHSIAGKANLDKADLEPALKSLKDRLMTKNVAEEIVEKLCESVAASLEGKKLASFTVISSIMQVAIEKALVRILTPRRSIDILRDVLMHLAPRSKR
ncbi:hypothetical protein KPL70_002836 [Citrus sinensis]|nr:hypothetical protein KPL70_002836 [Citrus sinensis]